MPTKLSIRSPRLLLLVGSGLIAASHMRWGIAPLAWVAPLPFLLHLRATHGWRSRLAFAVALSAGFSLAMLKIITAPLNPVFALLFALPIALFQIAAYLLWDALRRRHGEWISVLSFPALMVVAEHLQHRLTPFGTWGAAAYTQLELLPLLQLASLFGIAGVGFVVYFFAAALESKLSGGSQRPLVVATATAAVAFAFGVLRLELARPGETSTVAAVGTDGTFNGWPLPPDRELERIDAGLFERTARAARSGAKLVAWTEAATLVKPEREAAFVAQLSASARANAIELVAAYVVPLPGEQRFENKYAWLRPDGTLDHSYLKHEPVPGEPAVRGHSTPKLVATAVGKATGALCYDYDFPQLALGHARLGIDLAVLPSSDWRGIDPIHTQMASLRAIEGGFSLLRSTRFGLSAGYDAYGRARAWQSSFDSQDRTLLVALPRRGITTLYSQIGDLFVAVCGAFSLLALFARGARRKGSRARAGQLAPAVGRG